jgi:predicted 2-oxoglutarate/Fe(II)-dependent dioxygenase YbiX
MNFTRMVPCLDPDICDQITQFPGEYTRSTTIRKDSYSVDDARTNQSCTLVGPLETVAHDAINASLLAWSKQIKQEYPEIAKCLYLPGVRPDFDTYHESIGLLKYAEGERYDWHCDAPEELDATGQCDATSRLISVVVYLNDDFEGGHTEMLGRKYRPQKGKALIFPSNWNYPHRACPVTKGTKYALVTWYHPAI